MKMKLLAAMLLLAAHVRAEPPSHPPAPTITGSALDFATVPGQGKLPVYVSPDWMRPLPEVTRAVVFIHGTSHDADTHLTTALAAVTATGQSARGTLVVVPQFLMAPDVPAYAWPSDVLIWRGAGWIDGEPAEAPAPISPFAAIDAVLTRLADAATLPNLSRVVIAGHSAGAQLVQRYAVVGRGAAALGQRGIALRYVVANPSSYLWFGDDRPVPVSTACTGFARWQYGLVGAPAYVASVDGLEERYIARDVIYLLGEDDTDPDHPLLDKNCAAEAQGYNRYTRGMNYLFALELRHPNLVRHRIFNVWGVGHDSARMFNSPCGLAALFDRPGCLSF